MIQLLSIGNARSIDVENKENKIKNIILKELRKYNSNPKKNYQQSYIIYIVYQVLQNPTNTNFHLQKLLDVVVVAYKLTNRKNLYTSLDRYIKEIFDLTSDETLNEIAHPYSAEHKPTVKEFIIHLVDIVEAKASL